MEQAEELDLRSWYESWEWEQSLPSPTKDEAAARARRRFGVGGGGGAFRARATCVSACRPLRSPQSASAKGTVEAPGTNVRQKAGLNRSILGAAWHRFEALQTYKSEFLGGCVVKVDPRHTSVTCPKCGSRDRGNRENQAKFLCLSCGHADHADVNAAVNILQAGTRPSDTYREAPGGGRELRRAA